MGLYCLKASSFSSPWWRSGEAISPGQKSKWAPSSCGVLTEGNRRALPPWLWFTFRISPPGPALSFYSWEGWGPKRRIDLWRDLWFKMAATSHGQLFKLKWTKMKNLLPRSHCQCSPAMCGWWLLYGTVQIQSIPIAAESSLEQCRSRVIPSV